MKKLIITQITLIGVMFISTITSVAQQNYKLDRENSSLLITGTSSIHDWEMKAEDFNAQTILQISEGKEIMIDEIDFSCDVSEIESGKRIMDNKAHDALKEKKYPEISFNFDPEQPATIEGQKSSINGKITIAGVTKQIKVPFNVDIDENQLLVEGEVPLKMTDFNIEPPTAMLGTLETGNEIVVKFNFEFDNISKYTEN